MSTKTYDLIKKCISLQYTQATTHNSHQYDILLVIPQFSQRLIIKKQATPFIERLECPLFYNVLNVHLGL